MTDQRVVLLLGSRAGDGPRLPEDDVARATSLVVIAIGWPLSPSQDRAVAEVLALARAARVVFDGILAASPKDAAGYVTDQDRVLVDGSPRERRQIRRALGSRAVTSLDAR